MERIKKALDLAQQERQASLEAASRAKTAPVAEVSKDADKPACLALARQALDLGLDIIATRGTAAYLESQGLSVRQVNKVLEGHPHVVDAMINGEVDLVFNTTEGQKAVEDSFSLRRTALMRAIPYYTTVSGARAALMAIAALKQGSLEVAPLQAYFRASY